MDKTILISVPVEDLQALIIDSVNECLKTHANSSSNKSEQRIESDLLDIREAGKFLGLAIPTLYTKVSERSIPHSKRGKKLFFSRTELIAWVNQGRRKTLDDLKEIADKE